jgi:predicted DNA-binding transcriptional regulator AlpA
MEDKRDNPQELLRTSGAAAITGLSISTLNKLRCSGGGPAFLKLGRAVRYKPVDLKDWLDSRRVMSTSEIVIGRLAGNRSVRHD